MRRIAVTGLAGLFCLIGLACAAEPRPTSHKPQTGQASYYRKDLSGQKTASGQPFDPAKLTAASKSLPLGTTAKVTNQENGKSVKVTVTDRGPYAKGRIIDVSPKAADRLELKDDGVATVKVTPLKVPDAKD